MIGRGEFPRFPTKIPCDHPCVNLLKSMTLIGQPSLVTLMTPTLQRSSRAIKGRNSPEEEATLVSTVIDNARRAFPFTHDRVERISNKILNAQTGTEECVGKNWVDRFIDRHGDSDLLVKTPPQQSRWCCQPHKHP